MSVAGDYLNITKVQRLDSGAYICIAVSVEWISFTPVCLTSHFPHKSYFFLDPFDPLTSPFSPSTCLQFRLNQSEWRNLNFLIPLSSFSCCCCPGERNPTRDFQANLPRSYLWVYCIASMTCDPIENFSEFYPLTSCLKPSVNQRQDEYGSKKSLEVELLLLMQKLFFEIESRS